MNPGRSIVRRKDTVLTVAEYYVYAGNMQTLMTAIERAMDDREVSLVYTN